VIAIVVVIIAWTQCNTARRTSAQADFDLAVMYQREVDLAEPKALAHLARSLRTRPEAPAARRYLVSLLRDRLWYLPATEPLRHQATVVEATFSPDGATVLTMLGRGKLIGKPMRSNEFGNEVFLNADQTRLLTEGQRGADLWDVATGKRIGAQLGTMAMGAGLMSLRTKTEGERSGFFSRSLVEKRVVHQLR